MLLQLSNVYAGYEGRAILRNINLEVGDGKLVMIHGPNASGKTTLANTILGLIKPIKGRILFSGEEITNLPTYERVRRGIGYCCQQTRILPGFTVRENLEMASRLQMSRSIIEITVRRILKLFPDLQKLESIPSALLSGGERKLLSIGMLLMMKPKLMILDEPFLELSHENRERVMEVILRMRDSNVSTLLMSSDINTNVRKVADEVYFLEGGYLRRMQPPSHFKSPYELTE